MLPNELHLSVSSGERSRSKAREGAPRDPPRNRQKGHDWCEVDSHNRLEDHDQQLCNCWMRKDGRDGKGIVCILFYVVLISGINMSSGALFLGWKLELWTMSSSAVSMLEALAVMLPSGICTVLSKMNVPSGFFWSAFGLSAGAFTISSVCLGMKRNSIFRHEWVGMIFILGFGAFLGFTPQEEFLVLLPLAVSFLLIMTRLFYPSSWDVSSVSGETLGVDEKGRARK